MSAGRCIECDASPGFCDHDAGYYLPQIVYDRVGETADGLPIWAVRDSDRWRVDHPPSSWPRLDPASIDHGTPAVETFEPVTTEAGGHVRKTGLRLLGKRYRTLAERANRRSPTPYERNELESLERAIGQLQAMAPTGPLQPGQKGRAFG